MVTHELDCGEIDGQQVTLRAPVPEKDAETGLPWITDLALASMFMMDWRPDLEEYIKFLGNAAGAGDRISWMIYLEEKHVGITAVRGLSHGPIRIGESSIIISPDHQRTGIATRALIRLQEYVFGDEAGPKLDYLHVTIRVDNTPSLELFQSLGYQQWRGSPILYYGVGRCGLPCKVWQAYLRRL